MDCDIASCDKKATGKINNYDELWLCAEHHEDFSLIIFKPNQTYQRPRLRCSGPKTVI